MLITLFVTSTTLQISETLFSILNCNVRCLNANFDHLPQMLVDLNFPFTVTGITETWINSDNSVDYHLPGDTAI